MDLFCSCCVISQHYFTKLKDPQSLWTPHQRHEASVLSVHVFFPIGLENYKEEFYYFLPVCLQIQQ